MATSQPNSPSTGIQAEPPPAPSSAVTAQAPPGALAPGKVELTPETFAQRLFRFDMGLLALVLVLAFFLGSFVATNSDVFLHLGLGNPFREGADTSGWPHHAWLSSVLLGMLYEPYSATADVGGQFAVGAKALVVVGLAVVLCLIRRRGQSWLLPVLCVALAVVVMSPRLLLQPFVVSLLFLGITLRILTLSAAEHPRAIWWLPALFLLWVNMDQWFVLGPLTVALWLVGLWLQGKLGVPAAAPASETPPTIRDLAMVLGVGLVACVINPWGARALTLPLELAYPLTAILPDFLTAAGRTIRRAQESDPTFITSASPFSSEYYGRPSVGENVAGLAYFVLLLLGVASFVLPAYFPGSPPEAGGKGRRGGFTAPLFVVFLFFAILSVINFRLIALFAVVTGPIAALNLQDYLRLVVPASDRVTRRDFNAAFLSRAGALVTCLILLGLAWPGWLHGNTDVWRLSRHVAWGVAEDPGVPRAAELIRRVQTTTKVATQGLNYSLEGGNQFAWHTFHDEPTVQLFLDGRLGLHTKRAAAFGKIRAALREQADLRFGGQARDRIEAMQLQTKYRKIQEFYQSLLRENGIDYVVFTGLHYDGLAQRVVAVLYLEPHQWALLYHDGRTAVFGWTDPAQYPSDPFRAVRLDVRPLGTPASFPPNVPKVALASDHPPPAPEEITGWHEYAFGPPRPALAQNEAAVYMMLFEMAANNWQGPIYDALVACGGIGCAIASGMLPPGQPVMPAKDAQGQPAKDQRGQVIMQAVFRAKDPGPPGALVLAVRAGRNGTVESPQDAAAYQRLGLAYYMLGTRQEDYWTGRAQGLWYRGPYKGSLRQQFRTAQLLTALESAVVIQPDHWEIHKQLADLYFGMRYDDVGLEHLAKAKEALDARTKLLPKEQAEAARKFREEADQQLNVIGDIIKRRKEDYTLAAKAQPDVLLRFNLALFDPASKMKDAFGQDQPAARGLIRAGLKLLQETKVESLKGDPEKTHAYLAWQIFLVLSTGQARAAEEALQNDKVRSWFPPGEVAELRAMAAAALGDYAAADKFLDEADKGRKLPSDDEIMEQQKKPLRQLAEMMVAVPAGMVGDDNFIGPMARVAAVFTQQNEVFKELTHLGVERLSVAEVRLMRGLLALERGDTQAAAKHLRAALRIAPLGIDFPDRPVAQRYLELLEAK